MDSIHEGLNKKVQIVILSSLKSVLLLQTHGERGEFWQNVTGGVDEGEELLAAAWRELDEETGLRKYLQADQMQQLGAPFQYNSRWGGVVSEQSYYILLKKELPPFLSTEHKDYEWVPFKNCNSERFKYPSNWQKLCEAVFMVWGISLRA